MSSTLDLRATSLKRISTRRIRPKSWLCISAPHLIYSPIHSINPLFSFYAFGAQIGHGNPYESGWSKLSVPPSCQSHVVNRQDGDVSKGTSDSAVCRSQSAWERLISNSRSSGSATSSGQRLNCPPGLHLQAAYPMGECHTRRQGPDRPATNQNTNRLVREEVVLEEEEMHFTMIQIVCCKDRE
ncbi:unnamed protein product [Protopolystoma xenopodis]|uniref:Uncharacterized protein n=1 Tax=Protopolystoma xenopodis TaxID=117903 RepID=A0A448WLZ9_9PLAT|nr:unnamed protein product [Protopolystoma xenopodis]